MWPNGLSTIKNTNSFSDTINRNYTSSSDNCLKQNFGKDAQWNGCSNSLRKGHKSSTIDLNSISRVKLRQHDMSEQTVSYMNRHSYHGSTSFPLNDQNIPKFNQRFAYQPQYVQHNLSPTADCRGSCALISPISLDSDPSCIYRENFSGNILSPAPAKTQSLIIMSSNDSLGGGRREVPFGVDTLQQGPDIQDSESVINMSSGITMKRDEIAGAMQQPPHTHIIPQGSIPIQGQVLVDPATGQHYIVPQTAFYQPVQPMQPMFYPQPTHMYYPYGQPIGPQGFVIPSNGQSHSQSHYPVQVASYPQRHFNAAPPFRIQGYPQSVASTEDVSRRDIEERRFEDPPPSSPSFSTRSISTAMFPNNTYGNSPTPVLAQQYRQQNNQRSSPSSQPDDPEGGRDGFRRDISRSSAEFSRSTVSEFSRQGSGEFSRSNENFVRLGSAENSKQIERTPLYGGPPPWWGRARAEIGDSLTDVESKRDQHMPPPALSTASDTEANRSLVCRPQTAKSVRMDIDFKKMPEANERPKSKTTTRAVRMDIDLSKPLIDEEKTEKPKILRVPGTAFTVTFDSPVEEVSLQDAARKSAQARRILGRRSGIGNAGPNATTINKKDTGLPPGEQPANKSYLLNKLLHGANLNTSETDSNISEVIERKDNDVISEAGTYVVDLPSHGNNSASQMMPSRIIEDSDSSTDSDSDSEESDVTSTPPIKPESRSSNSANSVTGQSDILKELVKLRNMAGIRSTSISNTSTTTTISYGAPTSHTLRSSKPAAPVLTNQFPQGLNKRISLGSTPTNRSVLAASHQAVNTGSSSSNITPFRRGDGGRFSMRGVTAGPSSPQQLPKKPPFRAGGSNNKPFTCSVVQQRAQEMNAWLRRKDYNPMKAAAEAKKAKELKERGDQFVSNRSISFHVGPTATKSSKSNLSDLLRNRSQESLAQEEADQASQKVLAEYSRGVVKNINRLSQQSSRASGKHLTGLARAVDMLSQKCKKSIELIRSQNRGCLSVSIEDLLATAAEPPRQDESLNDQLDRLSDAFDAVQRYLEQYSLDGHQSPIPHLPEEFTDSNSVVSEFSSLSLRSQPSASLNSHFSGSVASAPRQLRTSTYRSKVLDRNATGKMPKSS